MSNSFTKPVVVRLGERSKTIVGPMEAMNWLIEEVSTAPEFSAHPHLARAMLLLQKLVFVRFNGLNPPPDVMVALRAEFVTVVQELGGKAGDGQAG